MTGKATSINWAVSTSNSLRYELHTPPLRLVRAFNTADGLAAWLATSSCLSSGCWLTGSRYAASSSRASAPRSPHSQQEGEPNPEQRWCGRLRHKSRRQGIHPCDHFKRETVFAILTIHMTERETSVSIERARCTRGPSQELANIQRVDEALCVVKHASAGDEGVMKRSFHALSRNLYESPRFS